MLYAASPIKEGIKTVAELRSRLVDERSWVLASGKPKNEYYYYKNCSDYLMTTKAFHVGSYAWVFPKNSPYLEPINNE
jgi:hypothetical protein